VIADILSTYATDAALQACGAMPPASRSAAKKETALAVLFC
jgi:hypothetical protein